MRLHILVLLLAAISPVMYTYFPLVEQHAQAVIGRVSGSAAEEANRGEGGGADGAPQRPSFIRLVERPRPSRRIGSKQKQQQQESAALGAEQAPPAAAAAAARVGGVAEGSQVTISLRLADLREPTRAIFYDGFSRRQHLTFTVGRREVMRGIDEAVRLVPVGHRAVFEVSSDRAFGARGFHKWGIGPLADLRMEIEIVDARQPEEAGAALEEAEVPPLVPKEDGVAH